MKQWSLKSVFKSHGYDNISHKALLKFKNVANYTFVNRTTFKEKTMKKNFMWGGMTDLSTLWEFDLQTLSKFCMENNIEIYHINNGCFILKNNNI
jgi:hypothetical protein